MARCLFLEDYSVEKVGTACRVTLEAWQDRAVQAFANIVRAAFPGSGFRRTGSSQNGFLGLQRQLRLYGKVPTGGIARVETFLELVTRCLTIEDGLDESHALAYHQDQDESTGNLRRSALGQLVNRAKYRTEKASRERIGEAVTDFIRSHPRYARSDAVASVPAHRRGSASGLSGRLVRQVADALQLRRVEISRFQSKTPQKDIVDDDRRLGVKKRLTNQKNSMLVDDDIDGLTITVVDDLYGSGGTIQEAARALKEAGAQEVLSLCITKQRLFEGVSLSQGI